MALAAHERAHLLARGIPVRIEVRDALMGLERLDAGDKEPWLRRIFAGYAFALAPSPRPPYFVVVGSDVLRYESY